jgi:hypothetical protein
MIKNLDHEFSAASESLHPPHGVALLILAGGGASESLPAHPWL